MQAMDLKLPRKRSHGSSGAMNYSATERPNFQEVRLRTMTALWLAPLAAVAALAPFPVFHIIMGMIAALCGWEWLRMTRHGDVCWTIAGIVYLLYIFLTIVYLHETSGSAALVWLLIIVAASDTAPFLLAASPLHWLIEHAVIAPSVHPQKSWDGALLSAAASILAGLACARLLPVETQTSTIIIATTCSMAARAGDFVESWIKRKFGVKNTGSFLPGHGGLLDRIDGILGAIPVFMLWMLLLER